MNRYLVTGGAGFIGSHIVEALVKRGEQVRVIDNFFTGKRENLQPYADTIELIEGDIRNEADVEKAISGVDYVVHQAAFRSVAKSVENPTLTCETNIQGTLNVLTASHKARVKRVVYASSSSVYGERRTFPEREDDLPSPVSPYAASKLAGEHYCNVFSVVYGLETVSLRYFNVFGPRQNPESKYSTVVPAFAAWMMKDEPPRVDGDGKQSRDFTYVSNVVEANLQAVAQAGVSGEVINVACGKTHAVLEIITVLNSILGKKLQPTFGPPRKGDVRKTIADITKMKKLLGRKPAVGFEEGLKLTVEWFKSHPASLIFA
jgi:nucleoside-diphosphate-sugar epimerase